MRANKVFKKVLLFIVIVLSLIIYVEYMNGNLPWLKEIMIEMGYDQPTNDGTTSGGEGYSLVPVESPSSISSGNINVEDIPEFTNQPIVILNGNNPLFTDEEKQITYAFESYSDLDELGRCGVAFANICKDLMPEDAREGIGSVKPSGWNNVKYTGIVDGGYLYNRCHLIGFQLAGENANKLNLITGTRYLNVVGMLPYENEVADYVRKTGNHVLYRVTPIYNGDELVCRGLTMEAYSVEDDGAGIKFYVYCYNNQPYITINYMDGSSSLTREVG